MNNFQNELQMLNVGDFQSYEAVPWDQNQYIDSSRQFGIGFGFGFRCFSCFSCFSCFFNCFNCFRCSNCFRCGGHRCGGRCGGH